VPNETTLALHWLDNDRRHILCADMAQQHALQLLVAVLTACLLIAVCVAADGALVGVWERCAVDLGSEWAEGLLESGLAVREASAACGHGSRPRTR